MSLSEQQVSQIAYLARLSLSDSELKDNTKDLNAILGLAEQLGAIETDGIEPMAHPLHMTQRLRADVVTEVDQSELFQSIAPNVGNHHYLVPTVIE
ncbi:Aspartyl-tRNA(Asn) amidotransferase subunit C (EC 6.3.5.6) @ Glutamyl-tRNA(Gln) amidotransferase subunit C (EC 6.3.5.7) [uncultured Gammaproteobacteria bacterium]|uniref:Asp-tRNA(Asn)/Glu-tRNA(Gln) amidotransferase subunit GatC n=1 Tax=Bathymodiolus heckerae thiotrophic gill symbiont TaxID=1052212 RepID=UPI0010B1157C|nr:Asp-tRNA(Asn)/Glu-tRNA(Gln) amidotransferase subunit GatC [Bathymodiolus heckerae thiotrophic gill symbiont]CAC9582662.1 Aspartyl-tRNA(Asn) amidotransferase subunit C (EC 6.3.5.6) @ Glutamyl-tRNA(Gln) amidotransferase subunit C (EC 6.3.5.7) [uncultured Gammaproteobacteria bacterium]CAC9583616.1 Aspartyl-tRNA(Asn) amidotransferase subunit C (EC 6.3.5.6) @ Glutamyl-tRNA(Gln) amidotransferase subunit C (EC 6.3.5.7) [uncultured Gammaproteobacteria bacterium]CAC9595630.1 Aspartyl-tRNA(Asn) amidotr